MALFILNKEVHFPLSASWPRLPQWQHGQQVTTRRLWGKFTQAAEVNAKCPRSAVLSAKYLCVGAPLPKGPGEVQFLLFLCKVSLWWLIPAAPHRLRMQSLFWESHEFCLLPWPAIGRSSRALQARASLTVRLLQCPEPEPPPPGLPVVPACDSGRSSW